MKKRIYISPETESIKVRIEPLLGNNTGTTNSDQDDDSGRGKGNFFVEDNDSTDGDNIYWDSHWSSHIWDEDKG